jgi:hypothetical protein
LYLYTVLPILPDLFKKQRSFFLSFRFPAFPIAGSGMIASGVAKIPLRLIIIYSPFKELLPFPVAGNSLYVFAFTRLLFLILSPGFAPGLWPFFQPLSFRTAKVRTFLTSAKLIFFIFKPCFFNLFMNSPLSRLRAAKVSRVLDCARGR